MELNHLIKNMINNKVVKASSWYTVTNFFLKGISFLTIPIFTRLLTTADYEVVSLYSVFFNSLIILERGNCNTASFERWDCAYDGKIEPPFR